MTDPPASANERSDKSLPPVEPPSALFILQLFLVPALLVTVIVGFVIVFFGWIGAGPETPEQFLEGLNDPSGMKRGKTAQDLAQVLPRKPELRGDVDFALQIGDMLHREIQKPPIVPEAGEEAKKPYLLEYFLPGALGNFHVPVGLPAFEEMIDQSRDKISGDEGYRLRMRNAVFSLALLGARMKEYDALPAEEKDAILAELTAAADNADGYRQLMAKQALACIEQRQPGSTSGALDRTPGNVIRCLEAGSQAPDELTRKYTILALASWDGPRSDMLLLQLCGDQSDIPDEGFERDTERPLESADRQRGIWEIRHNAALALARRASPVTPWPMVLATLDEQALAEKQYATNSGMAVQWVLKALRDLEETKQVNREELEQRPEILTAVARLSQESPTIAIRVQAQKLLSGTADAPAPVTRVSREMLLIVGLGLGVCFLLALAVLARWKRATA